MKNKQEQPPENLGKYIRLKIALSSVLLLCGFLYFLFLLNNTHTPKTLPHNQTILFADKKLTVFNDTYDVVREQIRFFEHEGYFLVRQTTKQQTQIYSLKEEKKIKTIPYLVLDYDGKNSLYYKTASSTSRSWKEISHHMASKIALFKNRGFISTVSGVL